MEIKKYVSLTRLSDFLDNLKTLFATRTEVDNKAPKNHTHDDRYFTETEITTKLSGKSDTGHKHTKSEITDFSHTHDDRYYTETEIDTKLSAKQDKLTIDTALSDTSVNPVQNKVIKAAIDGKANSSHGTHVSYSTTAPVMDGTASAGSASTVARSDHKHPTDTSRVPTTRTVNGKSLSANITLSASDVGADVSGAANTALESAKTYADTAATKAASAVKNDLLNGAGAAYDTLKELGDLIDTNTDAIDALKTVASGKADKEHTHTITNVTGLQIALDGKAATSHGTHVTWATTAPKVNGTAAVGTVNRVAREDHIHPTDTSRASQTDLDTHKSDAVAHITATERTNWGKAYTHSNSAHAPSNAEVNQNTFSNVKVGATTVAADTKTDTLELAGSNVTLTPDVTNDKITIGITKDNVVAALGYTPPTTNTTYNDATQSVHGLMSTTDKIKLDGIATGANKTIVDTALSTISTNPLQNKVVTSNINTLNSAIGANTTAIETNSSSIEALQTAVNNITEITSAEITALFNATA